MYIFENTYEMKIVDRDKFFELYVKQGEYISLFNQIFMLITFESIQSIGKNRRIAMTRKCISRPLASFNLTLLNKFRYYYESYGTTRSAMKFVITALGVITIVQILSIW